MRITLKPRHQEELERLQQALGGVNPAVAIAFLLQHYAPKAINLIEGSGILQPPATQVSLVAPVGTLTNTLSTPVAPMEPSGGYKCPPTAPSVPIVSESEAALNALMDSFG